VGWNGEGNSKSKNVSEKELTTTELTENTEKKKGKFGKVDENSKSKNLSEKEFNAETQRRKKL
jgi:hypothetical protein